jgi:hypothetical protein
VAEEEALSAVAVVVEGEEEVKADEGAVTALGIAIADADTVEGAEEETRLELLFELLFRGSTDDGCDAAVTARDVEGEEELAAVARREEETSEAEAAEEEDAAAAAAALEEGGARGLEVCCCCEALCFEEEEEEEEEEEGTGRGESSSSSRMSGESTICSRSLGP